VADPHDARSIRLAGDPPEEPRKHVLVVAAAGAPAVDPLVGDAPAVGIEGEEPGIGADALDPAAMAPGEVASAPFHGERGELDARRPGIEDEDDVCQDVHRRSFRAAVKARCSVASPAATSEPR
jgi:hypothetical protein